MNGGDPPKLKLSVLLENSARLKRLAELSAGTPDPYVTDEPATPEAPTDVAPPKLKLSKLLSGLGTKPEVTAETPESDVLATGVGGLKNLFTVTDPSVESTVPELAVHGLKAERDIAFAPLSILAHVLTGGKYLVPSSKVLEKDRSDVFTIIKRYVDRGEEVPQRLTNQLVELHHQIEDVKAREQLEEKAKRGRELVAERTPKKVEAPIDASAPESELFAGAGVHFAEAFKGSAIERVLGGEPPKTRAEAAAGLIFSLPAQAIRGLFEVKPSQAQRAEAVAGAVGIIGTSVAPFLAHAPPSARVELGMEQLRNPEKLAVDIAQARTYHTLVKPATEIPGAAIESVLRDVAAPEREVPSVAPHEEQAAIKKRLESEESPSLLQATIAAHNRERPSGTTIVPGVTKEQALPLRVEGQEVVLHHRADGLTDVAIAGKNSPLVGERAEQFREHGHFVGETVSWNGKEYAIEQLAKNDALLKDGGLAPIKELRRIPVVETDPTVIHGEIAWNEIGRNFESVREKNPNTPFDELVSTFARENGFSAEETPGLRNFVGQRLARKAREVYLTKDELETWDRVSKEMHERNWMYPRPLEVLTELRELPLSMHASSNGMTAEWIGGDAIEVRNDVGDVLGHFRTPESAREFINRTGQMRKAAELDVGGTTPDIPPEYFSGGQLPPPSTPSSHGMGLPSNLPPDPLNAVYEPPVGDGFIARTARAYREVSKHTVEYYEYVSAFDSEHKTRFTEAVRGIQQALRMVQEESHPYDERLGKISKLLKGRSQERAAILARYQETMSSKQVVEEGYLLRPLNQREINMGEIFAAQQIDLGRVTEFVRRKMEIEERVKKEEQPARIDALQKEFNLDENHMLAARLLRAGRDFPIEEFYTGHVVRYAQARMLEDQGFDLTPEGFARDHNLTSKELGALKQLDALGGELADAFGIPEWKRIRRWLPHFAAEASRGRAPELAFLEQAGVARAREIQFISELARTGELEGFLMDPVIALKRYINAGFQAKHLNPALRAADVLWKEELAKLPDRELQNRISGVLTRFLLDVKRTPTDMHLAARKSVENMLGRLGVKIQGDVLEGTVNTLMAAYSIKFLGGRIYQGLRDFHSFLSSSYSWFGTERTARILKEGFMATTEEISAARKAGQIPTELSPVEIESPSATISINNTIGKGVAALAVRGIKSTTSAVNTIAEWGLKASLQPIVYKKAHYGAWKVGRMDALHWTNEFAFGNADMPKVAKELMLDRYEPSFVKTFLDRVNARDFQGAADLYGQETGKMVVVTYGHTNHPVGWRSISGRLVGGFGKYPMWVANMFAEGAKLQGGAKYAFWSRFWASQAVAALTLSEVFGIDPYNWYIMPALRWWGGPAVAAVKAIQDVAFAPVGSNARSRGLDELKRQLPWPPLAVTDALAGLRLADDGGVQPGNPVEALARMTGAKLRESPMFLDRTVMDRLFGAR